ncbi:conserved exported hypothetical protein [uncultured Stenotrophomonas sp.]|uniref:Uncharacterized protein n=1 Tax=uncultured Stenotrophomonas sp. TaxID=165438 RepID=A0A1Y5Q3K2_9GAMM|nr:conserved exported hypothetical protein [uncultured Stenotrophomonas sp.]
MKTLPARHGRILRLAGLLALLCYALYLLAGNAFLNSRFGHDVLNRRPEAFAMEWSGGHTFWPGRVTLREVRMRGHVRRMQWSAQADAVHGRIALWPLLRKELQVPWVEADGVAGSLTRAARERPAPPPRPGGWTLDFRRIATGSLRAATLGGWQVTGDGHAEVGFGKQLRGGPMELRPSTLQFDAAQVSRGDIQWLRDARLSSTFTLPRHVSAEHPGLAKLDLLAATLDLHGTAVGLQSTLGGDGRYDFAVLPGNGELQAKLSLARGVLAPGSQLQLRLPLSNVDAQGTHVANQLDLHATADDALHLRATLPDLDGRHPSLDATLDVPGIALPLKDWRERLMTASGEVRAHGHLPSIGGVVALFTQADWMGLEGSGTVDADLKLADGRLLDGSRLQVSDVEARADVLGNRFRGKARAQASIASDAAGNPQSRLDVVMEAFSAAPSDTPGKPYFTGERLRLETLADARLERMKESMRARVRFERARIPELAVFNSHLPNDTLRFAGGSGMLSGDLRLDGDGDVGRGTLRVEGRQVRLAVAGMNLRGDVMLDARLRRGNLRKGEFELGDSSARVRNVAFTEPGGTTHSGWWATLDIDSGRAEWKAPSSASGNLRVRMRDVGFLLAMFADRTDLPAWVGKVVDAGEARLSGKWLWQGKRLVLDQARAQNERFTVDARLALEGPRRHGDLHLKWGILGVGVELQDGNRKYHLRGARQWYDSRPPLLR